MRTCRFPSKTSNLYFSSVPCLIHNTLVNTCNKSGIGATAKNVLQLLPTLVHVSVFSPFSHCSLCLCLHDRLSGYPYLIAEHKLSVIASSRMMPKWFIAPIRTEEKEFFFFSSSFSFSCCQSLVLTLNGSLIYLILHRGSVVSQPS